ncbi:MAG TPA: ion channel [Flavobacteriaceae bacterium]|nr:ion channel [Flavobacteriaceae bacterium]
MKILLLIFGFLLSILIFWDFFLTTVSGSGFGPISKRLNKILAYSILKIRSKTLFHYSGFIHTMATICLLFGLFLLSVFLVFISGDQMVVHEETHLPATPAQRFYYICYLLSTAGFGKYIPGNSLSEFFSSIYSFSGFILLTISMAYLISVINSVLLKKELALYISGLGKNVNALYHYFTVRKNLELLIGERGYIRQMVNKNTSNLNTFPILCFFMTRREPYALSLQMARLYEVLIFLKNRANPNDTGDIFILNSMLKAIENYLEQENSSLETDFEKNKLQKLRAFWDKHGDFPKETPFDQQMNGALKKAGWDWEKVYELN